LAEEYVGLIKSMRRLKRLTARTVAALSTPGRHADGGNLYLTVTKAGTKQFTFMYERGKQHEIGLGSVNAVDPRRGAGEGR
jgi:hypothetical protein